MRRHAPLGSGLAWPEHAAFQCLPGVVAGPTDTPSRTPEGPRQHDASGQKNAENQPPAGVLRATSGRGGVKGVSVQRARCILSFWDHGLHPDES